MAGLARGRGRGRAEIAGKGGVAKGTEEGGDEGGNAPRKVAASARTATAKMMAATTRMN